MDMFGVKMMNVRRFFPQTVVYGVIQSAVLQTGPRLEFEDCVGLRLSKDAGANLTCDCERERIPVLEEFGNFRFWAIFGYVTINSAIYTRTTTFRR